MVNFLCQPNHLKTPRLNISSISGRVFPNEITLELVDSVKLIILQNKSSVQFSCLVMSYPLQPHGLQHTRLSCPSQTPRAYSNSCPLSWWCHPTTSASVVPFSSCLQSFNQHQGFFQWVSSLHQVAKVLEFQLHHQSFQWIFRTDFLEDGLVGSPCCPRDSQDSSPAPQFEGIKFFGVLPSLWSSSHNHMWPLGRP